MSVFEIVKMSQFIAVVHCQNLQ